MINTALNDVEEMGNDTAGGEAVADIVEVKAPRIGQAAGEDFKILGLGMKAPDPGIEIEAVFLFSARLADERVGENSLASVEPTVWSPDETVECFMSVVNPPTIEEDSRFRVGNVVAIGIGNEEQIGRSSKIDAAVPDGDSGGECQFVVEELLVSKTPSLSVSSKI